MVVVKSRNEKNIASERSLLDELDLMSCMDGIPHGILIMDSSQRVVVMNRYLEALVGYDRGDVCGVKAGFVLRCNFQQRNNPFDEVILSGKSAVLEGDIINQGRKKIPVRFTLSALVPSPESVAGVLVVVEDISLLKDLDEKAHGFPGLNRVIGQSSKMMELFDLLPMVARTDASVLITGETGTGKDFIAEAIHKASKRAKHSFIKVNCGALPETLLESELFGHVRGAFTGADRDKPGLFRLAEGGTIFLTEIGDLPLPLQVKLLTVLDDKEFFPVGGSKKVLVDVRIIAATHRDLASYVKQGKFREDLFYRLNVLCLHLPSLRERGDDVRLLLDHFLRDFCRRLEKNISGFSASVISRLSSYHYPGNVRELRNVVEYAVNMCQGGIVEMEHLPAAILAEKKDDAVLPYPSEETGSERSAPPVAVPQPSPPDGPQGWKEMEKKMILDALVKARGKRTRAAELLGWGRSTLWRKIKTYGLT